MKCKQIQDTNLSVKINFLNLTPNPNPKLFSSVVKSNP